MTATTWLQYFCCTHSSPQPGSELLTTTSRRSGKAQGHSSTHQSLSSCLPVQTSLPTPFVLFVRDQNFNQGFLHNMRDFLTLMNQLGMLWSVINCISLLVRNLPSPQRQITHDIIIRHGLSLPRSARTHWPYKYFISSRTYLLINTQNTTYT